MKTIKVLLLLVIVSTSACEGVNNIAPQAGINQVSKSDSLSRSLDDGDIKPPVVPPTVGGPK